MFVGALDAGETTDPVDPDKMSVQLRHIKMIQAAPMLTTTNGPHVRCTQSCLGKNLMIWKVPRATRGASGPFAPTPSVDITTSAVTTSNKQMPRIADIIIVLLHFADKLPTVREWQPDLHQTATWYISLRRDVYCMSNSGSGAIRGQPAELLAQLLILLRQELKLWITRSIGLDRPVIGVQHIRFVFTHLRLDPLRPVNPG